MTVQFYETHRRETSGDRRCEAIASRELLVAPIPEIAQQAGSTARTAPQDGPRRLRFKALAGKTLRPGAAGRQRHGAAAPSASPYGFGLGITYPKAVGRNDGLSTASPRRPASLWSRGDALEVRAGVCLEVLAAGEPDAASRWRNAVMHTTGQSFVMAFQAGGPHAQDRGLEGVAYAYQETGPGARAQVLWEKPQGKPRPAAPG